MIDIKRIAVGFVSTIISLVIVGTLLLPIEDAGVWFTITLVVSIVTGILLARRSKNKIERAEAKISKEKARNTAYRAELEALQIKKENISLRKQLETKKPVYCIGDKPLLIQLLVARFGFKKIKNHFHKKEEGGN